MPQTGNCRPGRLTLLVPFLLTLMLLASACSEKPVLGPINDTASIVLMSFEAQGEGVEGVVYRQINRFEAFLAQSEKPVLVVFYSSLSPANALIIPRLEQMADDYRDQLEIVWIDANAESAISKSFNVEILPQFSIVVGAERKRSMIGYGDEGAVKLAELLKPYLVAPSAEK
jgi:thioredoxin 1